MAKSKGAKAAKAAKPAKKAAAPPKMKIKGSKRK